MHPKPISGGPILSKIMVVGQAPGDKEPVLNKPFAWTAGKTLFKWFHLACGWTEQEARDLIYFAAVCRCFPGKKIGGGDRVPNPIEIESCREWLKSEIEILKPSLIIPVGKLGINQFLEVGSLESVIGKSFRVSKFDHEFDLIPLPHPSGASPWPRIEPGKTLTLAALEKIGNSIRQLSG
jgi:uracil-DNA glycosylase